jgi:hypothetical protein
MRKVFLAAIFVTAVLAVAGASILAAGDKPPAKQEKAEEYYRLDTSSTTNGVKPGEEGFVVVEIKPLGEYKMNLEYPQCNMTVTETAGLSFKKLRFTKADLQDRTRPVFKAAFKAVKPGVYEVPLKFKFGLSNKEGCVMPAPELKVKVEVK